MLNKFINFLYYYDQIGPNPKLYIFNKRRYKSIFSLILSIFIIIISTVFILYSFINYIINERPSIIYTKNNDNNEERKIYLKDTLLMFQFTEVNTFQKLNESIGYFEAEYRIVYDTGEIEKIKLKVEQCKPGHNLNSGFYEYIIEKIEEDTIEDIHYDKNVEDFYCIQSDKSDINLFYQPNIGYSDIKLNIIITKPKSI